MFDPDEMVPYAQIPFFVNCSDYNNTLSRQADQKSIVLLKNENNILPLAKEIKTIAVIGPNTDNFESLIGNYNGIPKDPGTVLEVLRIRSVPTQRYFTLKEVIWQMESIICRQGISMSRRERRNFVSI